MESNEVKAVVQTETFEAMVSRLFKNMDRPASTNIHAAVGISGEVAEFFNAVLNSDQENIPEELGDMRFYMQALMTTFGWTAEEFQVAEFVPPHHRSVIYTLVIQAGEVLDLLKKAWVYNKVIDLDLLKMEFGRLYGAYFDQVRSHGYTEADIQAKNMYKLSTGPKARYPLGYTDAAAIARADKQEIGASDIGSVADVLGTTG